MRAAESFTLVVEALGGHSPKSTFEAIRVLGGIGTLEAGAAIIRYIQNGSDCRPGLAEPALFNCYHGDPCQLARATLAADDVARPVLARVLAEVAIPGMPYDFAGLAADSNPDVRASAARILSASRPPGAVAGLRALAGDPIWFVRLRAIVALGALHEAGAIPTLIEGACDRHRLVRSRAASVLGAIDGEELRIIRLVETTHDRYALQALISDMERTGKLERMASMVVDGGPHLEEALLAIIRSGAVRMLTEIAESHSEQQVRQRLQKLLVDGRKVVSLPLQHVPEEAWSEL
jgi:HEAT repeat protein